MIHYTSSKIITSHYLQFLSKEKKILKKNYKKKTNKKLSSNYIKLKIVCKYARKSKSSEKEKENTSKSFCLTSLSLNTISLSKVKKMYQKVILHVNRQKNPRTKILYLSPHTKQNQKSIHFFPTCAPSIHTVKKFLKKLIYIKSNKFLKRKEVKNPFKSFLSNTVHVHNKRKKIYHLIDLNLNSF